jgi:multidrug resistance efflux pump
MRLWPRIPGFLRWRGAGAPGRGTTVVHSHSRGRPSLAVKRFMARYILYLEIAGYAAVSLVALAIVACFFFQVDDVIRLVGDPIPIKPRAEPIKRPVDALVTRVFVQNHQPVRQGDLLIEVVERPNWMSRYLVMRQMRALLDEFEAPGQAAALAKKRIEQAKKEALEAALRDVRRTGAATTEAEPAKEKEKEPLPLISLTPEEELLRVQAAVRLSEWETREVPKSPRLLIRAPIDGIVLAPDDLDGKLVDADTEILKVVDLNDLRLTGKLDGETVADARTGQWAVVKAIVPDYKTGMLFRGDTVPRGSYFWQKERVVSYRILDPKLKEAVKDALKDRKITQRNDIPFDLTEVTDVELNAEIETSPAARGAPLAMGQGSGPQARLLSAAASTPGNLSSSAAHTASGSKVPLTADAPGEMELYGKVVEGKHLLTVQVADIPAAVTRRLTESVAGQIRGRTIEVPREPEAEGAPTPIHPLRVEEVRSAQIIAKVKAENANPRGTTSRLKKIAARTALRGASLERRYEATIQIQNPPQFLKDRVLELLEQGKEVKARVSIKTGRRRIAFLLLKR